VARTDLFSVVPIPLNICQFSVTLFPARPIFTSAVHRSSLSGPNCRPFFARLIGVPSQLHLFLALADSRNACHTLFSFFPYGFFPGSRLLPPVRWSVMPTASTGLPAFAGRFCFFPLLALPQMARRCSTVFHQTVEIGGPPYFSPLPSFHLYPRLVS